jgi:hypothetical protein
VRGTGGLPDRQQVHLIWVLSRDQWREHRAQRNHEHHRGPQYRQAVAPETAERETGQRILPRCAQSLAGPRPTCQRERGRGRSRQAHLVLPVADARIDRGIGKVGEQVAEQDPNTNHQDHTHQE